MPGTLLFYQGAVSYTEYWSMPHDELEHLIRVRDATIKQRQAG